jgi:hypothetical protein
MLNDIMQPADKLRRIIHFITELERLHPFPDVNCRTICIFLLNRELMRYGFSPVILEDPNFFDGYAITELCNEVINGMENFRKVKQGQFFGLSNDEIFEKINASDNTSQDLETFAALQEPELSCFIRSPASSFSS